MTQNSSKINYTHSHYQSGSSVSYQYDIQGQLTKATHGDNRVESYSYDNAGNLLSFNNGTISHTYTYGDCNGWEDLLTAVDGQAITYDGIGNPTSYYNGYRYTMNWTEGRKLASLTYNGQTTSYEYDHNGIRTKKTKPDGSYTCYEMVAGKAVGETRYNAAGNVSLYMRYTFDESGNVVGISLWYPGDTVWTDYYFAKNLQGDVLAVYAASDNTCVAAYTYDSWGNILTQYGSLADINPFRYRGYYYDNESWFYYLQSRYYDPAIGRFINADAFASTGQGVLGNNMFVYCNNNPCNKADASGHCSYFLFFKVDCFMALCPTSQCYNPDVPNIIVIYDGRASGKPFPSRDRGDGGFQHQGQELIRRLSSCGDVTGCSYTTMDEFVEIWNSLGGSYDTIYILGHGQAGKFNARGGSLQSSGSEYSYSELKKVNAAEIYLYICNGDTWTQGLTSTAYNFANLTGAKVHAVKNGKLNFTWHHCFPYMSPKYYGEWTTTYLSQ